MLLVCYQAMVLVSGQSESTNAPSDSKPTGATEPSGSAAVGITETDNAEAIEPSGSATMEVLDESVTGNGRPRLRLDDVTEIEQMRDTLRAEHRFRGEDAVEFESTEKKRQLFVRHSNRFRDTLRSTESTEKKRKLDECTQAPQTELQVQSKQRRGESASPSSQCSSDMIDTTITNMAGHTTRISLPII